MEELAQKYRTINPEYFDLLMKWQEYILYPAVLAIIVAILIFVSYKIKLSSLSTMKGKFDLASQEETKRYFQANVAFAIALFLFFNSTMIDNVARDPIWFGIRFFIAVCIGVLHCYVAMLLLKYYWPKLLHKKLHKLRYTPRTNPKNGNKMKLLSEEYEDAYLDEGKQAEENVFSVDYDVWIDEETGDTLIEKYEGHLIAMECDRCGFMTLRLEKEEVTKEVSGSEDGELLKEYTCTYCNRVKRKTVILSHTIRQDINAGKLVDNPLETTKHVVTVKVDLFSNEDDHLSYKFQNLKEAKRFLDEFDFDKIDMDKQ
ncbi:MAG: hypothetical protein GY816_03520 [Cytophagales bacterium]|nr:hypothetical protein [Cytophagales bacterium]